MQSQRLLTPVPALLLLCGAAKAQVVDYATVSKVHLFEQTSATQVSEIPFLPWGIDLVVGGTLTVPPVVSGPMTVGEPFHNGGVLGWNDEWQEWSYGFPNFDNYGTQTLAELDVLFPSGTYSYDIGGTTVPFDLSGDLWPSAAPLLNLTGGTWSGGQYLLPVGNALSVVSSAHPSFGTHPADAVWLDLRGKGYEADTFSLSLMGTPAFVDFVVLPDSLQIGQVYEVEVGFTSANEFWFSLPMFPGALGAAAYENSTVVRVLVVPNDGPIGTSTCGPAVANSSGLPGRMFAGGSVVAADNSLELVAVDLPPNQFGYFICGQNPGFVMNPGGAQGNLCLGLPIGRVLSSLASSGPEGQLSHVLDLTAIPMTPVVGVAAGETWTFQCWYRDVNPTQTANFTDALAITYQ